MKKTKYVISSLLIFLISSMFVFLPVTPAYASDKPSIVGKSAITMDLATGEIIYAKDIDTKRYPASITKLMTALLFAENATKDARIPFTESAKIQPEYSLSANYGPIETTDALSGADVMNALLLFSANDSAYMAAEYVSGSPEGFFKLMNSRAKELGLKNTNFENPNGLHHDNHYTTAYDLALMGKAVLENEWVKETIGTEKSQIQFIDSQKRIDIENRNKLLGADGNIGGKTGYTTPAGRCLLAFYERDGRTLLGIVLSSEYGATDTQVFEDMNAIIDYSFAAQKVKYKEAGQQIAEVEAKYKAFGFFGKENTIKIPLSINEEILRYDNSVNTNDLKISVDTKDLNAWDIAGANDLKVNFSERGSISEFTATASLSNFDLIKSNAFYYSTRIGTVLILLGLLAWIFITLKNRQRRRRSFFGRKRKKTIFK